MAFLKGKNIQTTIVACYSIQQIRLTFSHNFLLFLSQNNKITVKLLRNNLNNLISAVHMVSLYISTIKFEHILK